MNFTGTLLSWYKKHKRDLPWRETRDPYKIWLSEIILQQTRVEQGRSYYEAFVKKYPSVQKLAAAREDDVLRLWQGLGYYSRARNLHATAKKIVSGYGGRFPSAYNELLHLKGIGEYTAAAIASFCFNEKQPVVDGNVYRVLSRIFGIGTPIDSTAGKKQFRKLAGELIDARHPAAFNQAIMEFGAIHCVPQNPGCGNCPFRLQCYAYGKKLVTQFPVKSKKTNITERWFFYLVMRHKGNLYIRRREANDIWKNLYDFPLIEMKRATGIREIMRTTEWKNIFNKRKITPPQLSVPVKHLLSHQKLNIVFITIPLEKKLPAGGPEKWIYVSQKQLDRFAFPVPVAKFLSSELL